MARTRRKRAELTESWDDVGTDGSEWEEDEQQETEEDRTGRKRDTRRTRFDAASEARKRPVREPELLMPRSPNGAASGYDKRRDQTPRFRLNERSLTSDAGRAAFAAAEQERAKTPRFRLNNRSMTSDAGRFGKQQDESPAETANEYAQLAWTRILQPVLGYLSDIVGLVLGNAKPFIAYAVFFYLLAAALVFASGFFRNSINHALSPICRIPGVTYLFDPSFCPLSTKSAPGVEGPAEFDKLVQAQSAFNEVLDASVTGANLPLDMKKSEAGVRDLKHVVLYSTLPSRNELVYEFDGFISTARQASSDLSKFNSRIGRAVDHILSTNRWTLSVIDGIRDSESNRGSISKFFAKNLNIFAPFQPVSLSRDVLLDQYLRHTGAVEEQILSLIEEAQALLGILENLDGRLDVIAGIAARDGLKAEENKDELFAYLWTKLGGNRNSVKKVEAQIQLLKDVSSYRRIAWAHVTTTVVKLQAIRDNLEDLRERVAMPETVGTQDVPLEVHIDAINLGIERLEKQRDNSRRLEQENYQRVVDRANRMDEKMIGMQD